MPHLTPAVLLATASLAAQAAFALQPAAVATGPLATAALAQPLAGAAAPATAGSPASIALRKLLDEHYEQELADSPLMASARGDDRYNDRLEDLSPDAIARSLRLHQQRLDALRQIDAQSLSPSERVDAGLLRLSLELSIEGAAFKPEQLSIDDRSGPQIWLPQMADRLRFDTPKRVEDYVKRLEAVPTYLAQVEANLRAGLAAGRVPPRVTVGKTAEQALAQASDAIKADPTRSPFFAPLAARPVDPAVADRARKAIADGIVPAYARFAAFLRDEYIPKARPTTAAADGIDGVALYNHRLRVFTTTSLTAQQVHEIGLAEVARIRAEMLRVIDKADWPGKSSFTSPDQADAKFAAFVDFLRTDPRFYHKSADDLLAGYRVIAKRIDPELPALFGTLPRNPYGVRPIPPFAAPSSPTAYYYPGSMRAGIAGYFLANTHRLDQRPKYEMIALTLHEAMPGHHQQIALADEMEGVHPFRTLLGYTVFVEGWALYAERLGLEMAGGRAPAPRDNAPSPSAAAPRRVGPIELPPDTDGMTGLFSDPFDDFGRLTYEMWRACRLVVDPGMHALGWDRQRAIDFMLKNTALSPLNIEREVDRYIAWPGQATAYKVGELKIRELRARAERTLGPKFDVRAFHDVVLGAGAVPLTVLEERVNAWIDSTAK